MASEEGSSSFSPEYTAMRKCYPQLISFVKYAHSSIAHALFAKGYISPGVLESVGIDSKLPTQKAMELVNAVLDRVQFNPKIYIEFINILEKEGNCANDIIEVLQTTYKTESDCVSASGPGSTTGTGRSDNFVHRNGHQESTGLTVTTTANDAHRPGTQDGFICPYCKKCSVDEFFSRNGCPQAVSYGTEQQNMFPYLNTKALSELDRQKVEDELLMNTSDMVNNFASFRLAIMRSFKSRVESRELKVKRVLDYVLSLGKLGTISPKFLTAEDDATLNKSKSVIDIFIALRSYTSFFHYTLLKLMIKEFPTQGDQERLEEYETTFDKFCKRNVFEVPRNMFQFPPNDNDWKVFSVKYSAKEILTLGNVIEVRQRIADILHVNVWQLRLCSIEEGCVCLRFWIPSDVAGEIFPVSKEKKSALIEIGVRVLNHGEANSHGRSPTPSPDVLEYLLKDIKYDPNQPDKEGRTPLSFAANKPEAVRLLLAHGATPPHEEWSKYLQVDGPQQPAEAYAKVFLVGFPGGGKCSLVKSFTKESGGVASRLINKWKKVSDVDLRTAGIITHDISSKQFGQMTVYDPAGHSEFYASHDVTLRSALSGSPSSIILLVADMRGGGEPFRKSVTHWCSFTENMFDTSSENLPFLIVVGSHSDLASSTDVRSCLAVVDSLKGLRTFSSFRFKNFVALDCRYAESSGMSQLRSVLSECCQSLKQEELMSFREHCFLVSLLDRFRGKLAVTISNVVSEVSEGDHPKSKHRDYLPRDASSVCDICTQLNRRGNIQFFMSKSTPGDSWIVLDKGKILNLITGSIFAPKGFREHMGVATDTGILPASEISPHFPGLDQDLIVSFMCHHQYCHEVTDHLILRQLVEDHSSLGDQFLFFPGLVTITAPRDVWESSAEFSHQFVWFLQCCHPDQFLSSRFLQVLVLRLAFCYAMAHTPSQQSEQSSIHRRCSVWKSGIFWRSLSGIDVIVEVVEQKKVVVYVRSRPQHELEGVTLRSAVISKVLDALKDFCPKVAVDEYIVGPDSIQYPLVEPATLVRMSALAMSITARQPFVYDTRSRLVEIDSLLYFEPFAKLGEVILRELFAENESDVCDEFIARFSEDAHSNTDKYVELLDISSVSLDNVLDSAPPGKTRKLIHSLQLWRDRGCSYANLCSALSSGSVFANRNPFLL